MALHNASFSYSAFLHVQWKEVHGGQPVLAVFLAPLLLPCLFSHFKQYVAWKIFLCLFLLLTTFPTSFSHELWEHLMLLLPSLHISTMDLQLRGRTHSLSLSCLPLIQEAHSLPLASLS